jgi:hypothetical protein
VTPSAYLAAGALVVGIGIGASVQGWRLGAQIAAMKQKQAELVASNHKTEAMWSAHVIQIGEAANEENDRLRLAAARAARAASSLHDAGSRRAAEASAPTASREAAAASAVVLADVLRRLDDATGELARYADAAAASGRQCERTYELTR